MFIFILLTFHLANSYEYSPFFCYEKMSKLQHDTKKSEQELNGYVESKIKAAIDYVNTDKIKCNKKLLLRVTKNLLNDGIVGEVENFAWNKMDSKHKCQISRKNSIYHYDGIKLNMMSALELFSSQGSLQPMLRVCGVNIGVDKLGHFMGEGYSYFKRIKEEYGVKNYDESFAFGKSTEEGGYGLKATGVKSYGDLAANASGMVFWENYLGGKDPYIKCNNGRFVKTNKKFDWCNYINSSFDEANNCSDFEQNLKKNVIKNMQVMNKDSNRKMKVKCPIEENKCDEAIIHMRQLLGRNKYKKYKKDIINIKCRNTAAVRQPNHLGESKSVQ